MAKKSAPKKKATPAKAKSAKSSKPAAKPAKSVKPVVKAQKPIKAAPKAVQKSKPALMTKKGKTADAPKADAVVETKKTKTIVSILETEAPVEEVKAEKISKIKPIKIDRGNVADEKAKWLELNKKYGKEKALNYKMTETFPTLMPLQHKVLGWGFILTNENDRLEVLFEQGIRMLISNYKT